MKKLFLTLVLCLAVNPAMAQYYGNNTGYDGSAIQKLQNDLREQQYRRQQQEYQQQSLQIQQQQLEYSRQQNDPLNPNRGYYNKPLNGGY